ncbi:MAG: deoxyguanosinetriphosphate triphosphohydrolase [Lactobacillaceae bacterium]|jgi:dGTPase|nr:deoxyguanosinetriphosphate triphosphohydrolase [Lactobacillaceae bacterium]
MTLATYAVNSENTKGRQYKDFPNSVRSPFQRDRDRIIHSSAFRLLDGKTQVFAYHEGKNYRTRLTHSIEVAQITRTICKSLNINEELGEAIALAHDLGHPPFGHSGERGLQIAMEGYGEFDHNVHSLKVVTKIETHYPQFEGLNLSWEVLEGIAKHNGPIKNPKNKYLTDFNKKFNLELDTFPSLEAQIANLADDVAYNNHDLDDGFRGGFFTMKDLCRLPFIDKIIKEFDKEYPNADDKIKIYNITRNTITRMVIDILENTRSNIEKYKIKTIEDIRKQNIPMAEFSNELKEDLKILRGFLMENFYTSTSLAAMDHKSQKVVKDLFDIHIENPMILSKELRNKVKSMEDKNKVAEIISEYIAGMTDIGALSEHERLFNLYKRF